ncbi:MATE family efflux transporter [Colwellia echini]|uniref:Multidrug-efflux transporter n=1 Tax=Colwellia echini TaxID=1982103 RepID=A0ABY3MUE3_9GAMM|nr:MATE family efflux transporter [Colwellia echini]TYK64838.1 MATE family efflux transporter [Colwellia echini]
MTIFTPGFLKETVKLAWPISLQSVLVTLLGMIDIIMVSHLGNEAVAAVGIGNRIFFVLLIVITGISTGVGIMSAQYYGASQTVKIKKTIVMAIIFAYLFLLPVIVLNFFSASSILELASSALSVIELGESYLWITVPSLFFLAVILIFEGALRATGQVKLPMLFSILAILLNVILNYWLINGGLGVEPMGVVGAAWATTLARLFHVLILVYCLKKIAHPVFPNKACLTNIYDRKKWFNFIQLTWPLMLSFGVWSLGTFVYQLIYGRIGTIELAVMSMLTPIEGMLIAFFFGFAAACSIIVGQNLGKNNFQAAWKTGVIFSMGGPIITFVLALIIYTFEDVILQPFQSMETLTLQLAAEIFVLIVFGTCLKVYNMTISIGILRAGGDNKYCLIIDTIGMWVVSIPLTFITALYFQWPLFYVVLTAYSEEVCKAFMFTWRMRKKVWLKNLITR